jgi:hypothetical protein
MKIAITGHQNLPIDSTIWLKKEITLEIGKNIVNTAYSSLARGADQVFASLVMDLGIEVIAVIPCLHYEESFKDEDKIAYRNLLGLCSSRTQLPYPQPSEQAFYAAGRYVAENCDVLFAIWDGKPAKGLGGTGDIVEYAMSLDKHIICLNPFTQQKQNLS